MPYKDPAEQALYFKKYFNAHGNENQRRWRKNNLARAKQIERECSMRRKLEVLSHYGKDGKLLCAWEGGCDVVDVDMLELDHVNNDGAEDRRKNGKGTQRFYARLRKNGFPEGYQTLCCNHNRKKEILLRRAECCEPS